MSALQGVFADAGEIIFDRGDGAVEALSARGFGLPGGQVGGDQLAVLVADDGGESEQADDTRRTTAAAVVTRVRWRRARRSTVANGLAQGRNGLVGQPVSMSSARPGE